MSENTGDIRREMANTRDQMSRDLEDLRDRAKERLDLTQLVREHPWPALGVAVAVGAAIGASGADERAAAATARAARDMVQQLRPERKISQSRPKPVPREPKSSPGTLLGKVIGASLVGVLNRVLEEMRVASRDWGTQMSDSSSARSTVIAATEVIANAPSPANAVPVPNEMPPAELGLRADAVEALGGGTHEPPLEPGAGELGARWS